MMDRKLAVHLGVRQSEDNFFMFKMNGGRNESCHHIVINCNFIAFLIQC